MSFIFDIESLLSSVFIPAVIGLNITPTDHVLFSLPSCIGGLNIRIPTTSADTSYSASRNAKRFVIDAIKGLCDFSPNDHEVCVMVARTEYTKAQQALYDCGISGIQSKDSFWMVRLY